MFEGFKGSLMFQQLMESFCISAKKITLVLKSKQCVPACERNPRWPRNLKSCPWERRDAYCSFLRISVETVNSPFDAKGWKNAVRYPFGFVPERATEKIPSFQWNCNPIALKIHWNAVVNIMEKKLLNKSADEKNWKLGLPSTEKSPSKGLK